MTDATDRLAEALRELTAACEAEFCGAGTEDMEPDDSKVAYPEEDCNITFGMIRRARKALAAHDSAQPLTASMMTPAQLAAHSAQGVDGSELEFEVWQGDNLVAGGSAQDAAALLSEANHYRAMYEQDGEVTVAFYTRKVVTRKYVEALSAAPTKETP